MIIPWFDINDTPDWKWNDVYRHWVWDYETFKPGIDKQTTEESISEYYRVKYSVANWIKPRSITEIGVRAGYSAAAFLQAGHTKVFNGIDFDNGSHGGMVNFCQTYAPNVIKQYGVKFNLRAPCDSQQLSFLPDGPTDLLHVDGDHSYKGCYHDIELGLKTGCTWILVDDFNFMKECAQASLDCAKEWRVKEMYYVYDGGFRGNILLKNPRT